VNRYGIRGHFAAGAARKRMRLLQLVDKYFFHFDIQFLKDSINQIMRQGAWRFDIFHHNGNRLGFGRANDNGQTPDSVFFGKNESISTRLNLAERNSEYR